MFQSNTETTPLSSFILYSLKYETISRFSHPLGRSQFLNSGLEGFQTAEVLVRVKCDLTTFLNLTRQFHSRSASQASSTSSPSVVLKPNLSSFLHPSRATNSLSIDFSALSDLLRWLRLQDKTDHRQIALKGTSRKSGDMLRILGTTCLIRLDKTGSEPALEFDCFLPFISCTSRHSSILKKVLASPSEAHLPGSVSDGALPEDVVMYRLRDHYDASQGRFLSPWKMQRVAWNADVDINSDTGLDKGDGVLASKTSSTTQTSTPNLSSKLGEETNSDQDTTFSIEWTPCIPLPPSMWTSDATHMDVPVMGNISLFFPTVTFYGSSTLSELASILKSIS